MKIPDSGLIASTLAVYQDAINSYIAVLHEDKMNTDVPSLSGQRFRKAIDVHNHVVGAAYAYADDILQLFSISEDEKRNGDDLSEQINNAFEYTMKTIDLLPEMDT